MVRHDYTSFTGRYAYSFLNAGVKLKFKMFQTACHLIFYVYYGSMCTIVSFIDMDCFISLGMQESVKDIIQRRKELQVF